MSFVPTAPSWAKTDLSSFSPNELSDASSPERRSSVGPGSMSIRRATIQSIGGEDLERRQERFESDQYANLRAQIKSLMSSLAEVRTDLTELRNTTMSKEVESVIERMIGEHNEHRNVESDLRRDLEELASNSMSKELEPIIEKLVMARDEQGASLSDVLGRVKHLAEHMGDAAEKRAQDLAETRENHSTSRMAIETRFVYMEKLIGESTQKHTTATNYIAELQAAMSLRATSEHHATLEQRLEFLERSVGESADQVQKDLTSHRDSLAGHTISMGERLNCIEGLLGESAEKHSRDLDLCVKSEHHATLEQRLNYLEKSLGESVDKHTKDLAAHMDGFADHVMGFGDHKASMAGRLEYIEGVLGESADRHLRANEQHAQLQGALSLCTTSEHHSTLIQRVDYLEQSLGESVDKHEKDLGAHMKGYGDHKSSMQGRLEYIEGVLGESADKHSSASDQLAKLHGALSLCAKSEHHATLQQRLEYLEKDLGESLDKHTKDLAAHTDGFADHMTGFGDHKVSIKIRLEYIEGLLGESAEKHEKDLAAHMNGFADHIKGFGEHKSWMEGRLEHIAGFLGESTLMHSQANNQLAELQAGVNLCAKSEHHATLEQRLEFLEKTLGESADKHDKNHSALMSGYMHHKSTMESRLQYIEGLVGDSAGKYWEFSKAADAKFAELQSISLALRAPEPQAYHSTSRSLTPSSRRVLVQQQSLPAYGFVTQQMPTSMKRGQSPTTRLQYLEAPQVQVVENVMPVQQVLVEELSRSLQAPATSRSCEPPMLMASMSATCPSQRSPIPVALSPARRFQSDGISPARRSPGNATVTSHVDLTLHK